MRKSKSFFTKKVYGVPYWVIGLAAAYYLLKKDKADTSNMITDKEKLMMTAAKQEGVLEAVLGQSLASGVTPGPLRVEE